MAKLRHLMGALKIFCKQNLVLNSYDLLKIFLTLELGCANL